MTKKMKNTGNLGLILGIVGFIAGIWLMFEGNSIIGIFGLIASAAIAYKGYQDAKDSKRSE